MTTNTLDIIGLTNDQPAACAYSSRKLSSAYTGPAMQCSYWSNASQCSVLGNVFFDTSTNTVTSNSGWISADGNQQSTLGAIAEIADTNGGIMINTWYDQSGNGLNASRVPYSGTIGGLNGPLLIGGGGQSFFQMNGHIAPFFFYDMNNPLPSGNNTTMLCTAPFQTLTNGVTVLVAGLVEKDQTGGSIGNTFVSKTNNNMPAPFDMYNNSWLLGGGGGHPELENTVIQSNMQINTASGAGIWGFNADNNPANNQVMYNSQMAVANHIDNNNYTYQDQNTALYIGSRNDLLTGLRGFCPEIIVLPKKYDFTDSLQAPINNMQNFWGITQPNALDVLGINAGVSSTENNEPTNELNSTEDLGTNLSDIPGFTVAQAAFSLRRLSSTYTGNAIKVTLPNGTSQDIGFNADGSLDTTALSTFCGTQMGRVTTWYDQSGIKRDAIQSTLANAPIIYQNNSVVMQNGKPSLYFDAQDSGITYTTASLVTAPFVGFQDEGFTCMITASVGKLLANAKFTLVNKTNNGSAAPWLVKDCYFITGNGTPAGYYCYALNGKIQQLNRLNTWMLTSSYNQQGSAIYDCVINNSDTTLNTNLADLGTALEIGALSGSSRSYAFNGYISEVIAFGKSVDNAKAPLLNAYNHITEHYNNNALAFDGSSDYVTLTAPPTAFGKDYTKEGWLYFTGTTQIPYLVISSDTHQVWIRGQNGKLAAANKLGLSGNDNVEASFPQNAWFHFAVTYQSSSKSMKLYINGDLAAQQTVSTNSTSPSEYYLGAYKDANDNNTMKHFFDGKMDNVRIWNIARTANDIKTNMSQLIDPTTTGLYYYMLFNQGVANENNLSTTTQANSCPNYLSNPTVGGTLNNFELTGTTSNWVNGKDN
jgi:hypothetical protein